MRHLLEKIRRDEAGNFAIAFALAAIPIVGFVGVGVDYARATRVQSDMQSAVDASALGGATKTSTAEITQTVDSIMDASLPGGAAANGVTYDLAVDSTTVTVSAQASVPTTISRIFRADVPVAVSATAAFGEPMRIVELEVTEFNSDAWDANSIYWYIIPEDGGVPAPDDMHLMLSNDPGNPAPDVPDQVEMGPDQRIGFALVNVTGGVRSYGNNSYGQPPGSTRTSYSHLDPENLRSTGEAECSEGTVEHAWDDNGGGSDDNDYNDAVYLFECTVIQIDPTSVVLLR